MQAIVDINGKQYQVQEGRYINVDRLPHDIDATFEIGNVLMVVDGSDTLVGAPFVDGATVQAKVLRHARGPKLLVYKMRCKKGYRRKNGHRQDFTQLQIEVVSFPGKKDKPKSAEAPVETKRPVKKATEKSEKPETEKPKADKTQKAAPKAAAKSADKAGETKTKKPAAKPKAEKTEAPAAEAPVETGEE